MKWARNITQCWKPCWRTNGWNQNKKKYFEKIEALMKYEIPEDLHCSETETDADTREANALFAEYAIDFAEQSFWYAAIAVLNDEKLGK